MSLTQYLKTIEKELADGNATEHTHRSALKSLIESLADKITATNEPQRIKCGAPDYIVTRGQTPLGYVEAKDVGVSLDSIAKSEQLERYRESLGNLIRVWINREQYFEGVPPEVWNFHVGGYQVCEKWLKDRKGRKLTYDDLTHYHHILSALNETIHLMTEIDTAIEAHDGWPLQ